MNRNHRYLSEGLEWLTAHIVNPCHVNHTGNRRDQSEATSQSRQGSPPPHPPSHHPKPFQTPNSPRQALFILHLPILQPPHSKLWCVWLLQPVSGWEWWNERLNYKPFYFHDGGEYIDAKFLDYFCRQRIPHRAGPPQFMELNMVAERRNQKLSNTIWCVLIVSGLQLRFWVDVAKHLPSTKTIWRIFYEKLSNGICSTYFLFRIRE